MNINDENEKQELDSLNCIDDNDPVVEGNQTECDNVEHTDRKQYDTFDFDNDYDLRDSDNDDVDEYDDADFDKKLSQKISPKKRNVIFVTAIVLVIIIAVLIALLLRNRSHATSESNVGNGMQLINSVLGNKDESEDNDDTVSHVSSESNDGEVTDSNVIISDDPDTNNDSYDYIISVGFNPSRIDLKPGEKQLISTTHYPENAAADYDYDIEDENIAYIDAKNYVHAISSGTTTIFAKTFDGEILGSCIVSVSDNEVVSKIYHNVYFNPNGGVLSQKSVQVEDGERVFLPELSRDYYSFAGWTSSLGENQGNEYSNAIYSDVTFNANWNENPESDWDDELPTSAKITEEKTQYKYRKKSYTTGSSSTMSGWTLYDTVESYGAEKTSKSSVQSSDTRKVWTTKETGTKQVTVYWYKHYKYYNSSNGKTYYSYGESWAKSNGYSGKWEYKSSKTELPYLRTTDGYKEYHTDGSDIPWFMADCNSTQGTEHTKFKETTNESYQYTLYHYQDKITIYKFYQWGDWSEWSFTPVSESDDVDVETRQVYKYIYK